MNRKTQIELNKADPPNGYTIGRHGLELTHNLRTVFHIGFIEKHKRTPRNGTNPLFDEYTQLLQDDTDWLIWSEPGISEGDLLTAESQILGRIFARAILSLNYNYRWFADLKTLKSRKYNKWEFLKKDIIEDMPDWIIAGSNMIASAEAKGTHEALNTGTEKIEKWSKQSNNVIIVREGIPYHCKSWLIASRWVIGNQRFLPKIYIEDPDPEDSQSIFKDDIPELERYISKLHTKGNLIRINELELSEAIERELSLEYKTISRVVFSLKNGKYKNLRFIGNIINPNRLPEHFDNFYYDSSLFKTGILFEKYIQEQFKKRNQLSYFDGLEVKIVKAHLKGGQLPTYENTTLGENGSLLADGSLLIPINELRVEDEITF